MSSEAYYVTLLREGKNHRSSEGNVYRICNTVLIQGPAGSFLVNPGSVWNGPSLISSLKSAGISNPEKEIRGVICTDGRAEHVGCLSIFSCAELMIVGYDIQKRGDIFLEHDFCDGITPYEFDEHFYVIGTPGQRGPQVSLIVYGHLRNSCDDESTDAPHPSYIAITGSLFADKSDATCMTFFDHSDGSHGDWNSESENLKSSWRRSREHVLNRADWIIPAYGPAFRARPEFASTPCVELA